jgi:hypothetical protein
MSNKNKGWRTGLTVGTSSPSEAILQFYERSTPPWQIDGWDNLSSKEQEDQRDAYTQQRVKEMVNPDHLATQISDWVCEILLEEGIEIKSTKEAYQMQALYSDRRELEIATPEFKKIKYALQILCEADTVREHSKIKGYQIALASALQMVIHTQALTVAIYERRIVAGKQVRKQASLNISELERQKMNNEIRERAAKLSTNNQRTKNNLERIIAEKYDISQSSAARHFGPLIKQIIAENELS